MKQTLRSAMKDRFVRAITAFVIVIASIGAAFALTDDQTRNIVARVAQTQQTSYYRVTINYNDPSIGSTTAPPRFGKLLQHSYITGVSCYVLTAFNAVSTNVVTIGTSATGANEIIAASGGGNSITPGSTGYYSITNTSVLGESVTSAADVTLYAKYTQTGTAATAGKASCIIEFIPNNDK